MKVVVSGCFSTGKTELCEWLVGQLTLRGTSVTLLPDTARLRPLRLNREQSEHTTMWLLTRQVSVEIEADWERPDLILCDRGVPDILAHALEISARSGSSDLMAAMRTFAEKWMSTYDLILATQVDPDRAPIADGLRDADANYRQLMATLANDVLKNLDNVCRLDPRGNPTAQALAAIDKEGRRGAI